ncbi:MAG TPA: hypothetical protein VM737_06770 [Gemmatimonadota bacterium]|nr:hypothetical protein [Gemmatimonadota bacterium]
MRTVRESQLAKDTQVSVRISGHMDEWLTRKAGEERSKADVVRSLIEDEIAREAAARLTEMFDAAAAELTDEDREDRDLVTGAFADRE